MRDDRYVQCRLTAETHRRLTALANRMKAKARAKPGSYLPALTQGKVGLSDVIDQLIFQLDNEEQRKRSYGLSRRHKPEPPPPPIRREEQTDMAWEGCPNVD